MAAHHLIAAGVPRRLAAVALVLGVAGGHWLVTDELVSRLDEFQHAQAMPQRLQVAYVREMAFTPPVTRPVAKPRPRRRAAAAPAPGPASAPIAEAAAPQPMAAAEPASAPEAADAPDEAASPAVAAAPESAASDAVAVPPFEWPVSTRLRYLLTGYFRGEVRGQAQVEWIRAGPRYQVHLDVEIGPSFAPLATRRMSSDGEITPEGLSPSRYDQETRFAFDDPYRAVVRFEGDRVLLANGQSWPRWPGVQDTASQFVQLSYLFDSQPQRLRVGEVVEMPLAMPRNVSSWVYDVVEAETLYTPFGEVPAYHLKPRREARRGGDLVTEIWIAPGLRHLPVRFRIHQDAETYVDLMLDRRPELAAADPGANIIPDTARPPP